MTLDVYPGALRRLGHIWDEAAQALPAHTETLDAVGGGADQFGRINQFMTPVLFAFVRQAGELARECGDDLSQAAWALRATADDLAETDAGVARLMRGDFGDTGCGGPSGDSEGASVGDPGEGVWV